MLDRLTAAEKVYLWFSPSRKTEYIVMKRSLQWNRYDQQRKAEKDEIMWISTIVT